MIIRFLISLPVWFIGTMMLPFFLVPIAVQFMDMKTGRLPWMFRWLETHDNIGWTGPASEEATAQYGQTKKAMRKWLLRNKAYRLRYWLGIPFIRNHALPLSYRIIKVINKPVSKGTWGFGYVFVVIFMYSNDKKYFEYQPQLGLGNIKLYFRIGWKLKRIADGKIPKGSTGMYTGVTPRTDDYN